MAGNIVPAICSTNSIAAALQVDLALRHLQSRVEGKKERVKDVYTQNMTKKVNFMYAEGVSNACLTCSPDYRPAVVTCPFSTPFSGLLSIIGQYKEICVMVGNSIVYEKSPHMDEEDREL